MHILTYHDHLLHQLLSKAIISKQVLKIQTNFQFISIVLIYYVVRKYVDNAVCSDI
jgi:hypothetical protein